MQGSGDGKPGSGRSGGIEITVTISPDELELLDGWRAKKPEKALSRPEAIVRLVEIGAHCEPYVARLLAHLEKVAEAEHQEIQETVDALRRALGAVDSLDAKDRS